MIKKSMVLLAALLACSLAGAQTVVSLPQDVSVDSGGSVQVCLSISALDDMIAADIDIAYDSAALDATAVQTTSLLSSFSLTSNVDDPGWVRLVLFATQPASGGGCAVQITFDALEPGCSLLEITRASINEGEIPSQAQDGLVQVRDILDRDSDGWSESAGDCSDRFDWIHPGSAEACNGADDDCDTEFDEDVVCPCGTFISPRNHGFWVKACLGSNLEQTILPAHVDTVNDSATFSGVTDIAGACAVMLDRAPEACTDADREFMTLLLNLASARLCLEQPVDTTSTTAPDVYSAREEVDALLADPGRDDPDCVAADTVAGEINEGSSVPDFLSEEIDLGVGKQYGDVAGQPLLEAVVLAWPEPDASAAGRPVTYEVHRSPGTPPVWALMGETDCHRRKLDMDLPAIPGALVLYQVIGVDP